MTCHWHRLRARATRHRGRWPGIKQHERTTFGPKSRWRSACRAVSHAAGLAAHTVTCQRKAAAGHGTRLVARGASPTRAHVSGTLLSEVAQPCPRCADVPRWGAVPPPRHENAEFIPLAVLRSRGTIPLVQLITLTRLDKHRQPDAEALFL